MLKFVPTICGFFAFGALAWAYSYDRTAYFDALRFMGMIPWWHPFIDSSFMYAMKACWEHGVDVYKAVPCDVDKIPAANARMAYSPLWQRLPFLPDFQAARVPVGVTTDLLWIASLSLLPPAQTRREAALLGTAAISTMVCVAMERNNIDVWMYLLAVAGLLVLMRGGVFRWAGYSVFLFAGLLKYYPLALLGLALRERPARFYAIAAISMAALLVFAAVFWRELAEALPNVPTGPPFADLFGVSNIPLVIGDAVRIVLHLSYHAGALVAFLARLGLTVLIAIWAWRLAREPGLRAALTALAPRERDWVLAGALVVGGCYMMGQNVSYRGIYLMIVLSGLLALHRRAVAPALREQLKWAAVLVVPMMWNGALRFWMSETLPPALAGGCETVLWLCREFAWVNLARVLLAVLLAYATETPAGRRFVTA